MIKKIYFWVLNEFNWRIEIRELIKIESWKFSIFFKYYSMMKFIKNLDSDIWGEILIWSFFGFGLVSKVLFDCLIRKIRVVM